MTELSLVEFFAIIAPLPILIAAAIGLMRIQWASKQNRYIVLLVVFASISQIIATLLWWEQVNNMFVSHVFTIVECYLLLQYYSFQFEEKAKRLIKIVSWLFVGLGIVDFVLSYNNWNMNAFSKGVECAILIIVSLITWRKTMVDMSESNLLSKPFFWVNSAVLVYFSANSLLFAFSESILSGERTIGLSLWAIHLFFMTVYYSLISIGLWKMPQK
ncbi:MAG: hypothetical protein HWE22_00815 [Flavobacteriales bacterium]|nr:hypothetical protein [Flavobacteriales bacterium]